MRTNQFYRSGGNLAATYQTAQGPITDADIRGFIDAHINNPAAVWAEVVRYNLTVGQIWDAYGGNASPYSQQLISDFLRAGSMGVTDWNAYNAPTAAPATAPVTAAPAPSSVYAPAPAPSTAVSSRVSALIAYVNSQGGLRDNNRPAIYEYIVLNGTTMAELLEAARIIGVPGVTEAVISTYIQQAARDYSAQYSGSTNSPAPTGDGYPDLTTPYLPNGGNPIDLDGDVFNNSSISKEVMVGVGVAVVSGIVLTALNKRKRK